MIDPNTGIDDGQPEYPRITPDAVNAALAQARGMGAPVAPQAPALSDVDPGAIAAAVAQARGSVPPMLARPQQPMFGVFAPPAQMRKERESSSWSQKPMSAAEKQQLPYLEQGMDQQIAAQQQQNANAQERAAMEQLKAEDLASFQAARSFKREQLVAEGEKQLTAAMTAYKQQFDKYTSSMNIKDYWAEAGTLKSVLAGIAMGIGELGRLRPGGENVAVQAMQQAVAQDFAKQKTAIERQAQVLENAKENIEIVNKFKTHQLNNLELKEAAAWDAIGKRWEANLKALGVNEEAAKGDETLGALRQKKAEAIMRVHESARRTIGGSIETAMQDNTGMMTPYQQYQMGRQMEADKEKDQQRVVPDWDGKPAGMTPVAAEAKGMRDALGPSRNIVNTLDGLSKEVDELGFLDRLAPQFSSKQQRIAGKLDTMLGPMTQALGAGTPQEAEAKRKLQTVSSTLAQDPETAKANIKDLQDFLRNNYNEQLRAKVPGYQPPANGGGGASPGGVPAGARKGKFKGRPAYQMPDGSIVDAENGARLK